MVRMIQSAKCDEVVATQELELLKYKYLVCFIIF